jgi:hypothetical protein
MIADAVRGVVIVAAVTGLPRSSTAPKPTSTKVTSTKVTSTKVRATRASSTQPAATTPHVDPNAPEVNSAGDIPDDVAFVTYTPSAGGFTVKTPEGWSRKELPNGALFTDKYNIIQVESSTVTAPPTVASVSASVTSTLGSTKGFKLGKASIVKRKAGNVVLVTYVVNSAPNEVTGKSIPVAVERYEFFQKQTSVVLTLSGAAGADNIDPWNIVTDSLTWKTS